MINKNINRFYLLIHILLSYFHLSEETKFNLEIVNCTLSSGIEVKKDCSSTNYHYYNSTLSTREEKHHYFSCVKWSNEPIFDLSSSGLHRRGLHLALIKKNTQHCSHSLRNTNVNSGCCLEIICVAFDSTEKNTAFLTKIILFTGIAFYMKIISQGWIKFVIP